MSLNNDLIMASGYRWFKKTIKMKHLLAKLTVTFYTFIYILYSVSYLVVANTKTIIKFLILKHFFCFKYTFVKQNPIKK